MGTQSFWARPKVLSAIRPVEGLAERAIVKSASFLPSFASNIDVVSTIVDKRRGRTYVAESLKLRRKRSENADTMAATALKFIVPFLLLATRAAAQRPENVSTCDYYTERKYGKASPLHQYHLIQSIVSLAFAGSSSLPAENVSEKITGILNPGVEEETGTAVNLLPWFNGSIPSSNLNNQAIGIDWLDDGEVQPLLDYLSRKTENVTLRPESNELYDRILLNVVWTSMLTTSSRLMGHFFIAFSRVFGCSSPPPPLPSTKGPVSLAYVSPFPFPPSHRSNN